MPPALIALGAKLEIASSDGERTIDLEDYCIAYGKQDLRPGECVARVLIPLPGSGQHFRSYKISKRNEQDISAVCAAFSIILEKGKVQNARICYGGMAETPKRAVHSEHSLTGKKWDESTIATTITALQDDFSPISDMRASASYRMTVAGNLLRRFYLETTGTHYPVRLEIPMVSQKARP
jgi:xanthine dehydrogenase small subunit